MPREDIKGNGIYSRYCQRGRRPTTSFECFFLAKSFQNENHRGVSASYFTRVGLNRRKKNESTNGTEQIVATISSVSQVSSPDSLFKSSYVMFLPAGGVCTILAPPPSTSTRGKKQPRLKLLQIAEITLCRRRLEHTHDTGNKRVNEPSPIHTSAMQII